MRLFLGREKAHPLLDQLPWLEGRAAYKSSVFTSSRFFLHICTSNTHGLFVSVCITFRVWDRRLLMLQNQEVALCHVWILRAEWNRLRNKWPIWRALLMGCNVIFVQLWVEHNLQIDLASEDVFSSLMLNRLQRILSSFFCWTGFNVFHFKLLFY